MTGRGATGRGTRRPFTWLGGILALYLAVPVVAFLIRVAGSGHRGFDQPGLWGALRVSVAGASISTVLVAVFGIPLAFALARSTRWWARVGGLAVQLPLALPPLMSGVLLIYLVGPYTRLGRLFGGRLTDSLAGVVIAQSFVAAPFLVIAARSAFATVDGSFEETAATLGHAPVARFLRVSLPMAGAGIRAGLLLCWLRAFGEYGATVLVAYHPYSLPVYTYVQFSGYGLAPTQAPTLLAVGVAAAAVVLAQARVRWRRTPAAALPPPVVPTRREPLAMAFDLDHRTGTFHLHIDHHARSPRLAIVGPSGSGKSLTLRLLAGLVHPDTGTVHVGTRDVGAMAPERRQMGYVPQGQSLLPHLTVWQQVTFGVGADPAVAAHWLDAVGLADLGRRYPHQLSGGQRQRVSLAQALARDPGVVLLDEPLSALDAPVRADLRRQLRRLQREAGISSVLVTHDAEEAAFLADEIVVLSDGAVLQSGPCREVFRQPAGAGVARLLGVANFFPGRVRSPSQVDVGGVAFPVATTGMEPGTAVCWTVRPEGVELRPEGPGVAAEVVDVVELGLTTSVVVHAGPVAIEVRPARDVGLRAGDMCAVHLHADAVHCWAPTPSAAPAPVASPSS